MCFSATASFAVGGALLALGVATLRRAGARRELAVAAIPLLFGVQQLIEGALWLAIMRDLPLLNAVATALFTLFSHLIWPVYLPLAVWWMEQNAAGWQRRALQLCMAAGAVVGVHMLVLLASNPPTAVAGQHIIYVSPFMYGWPMMVLYVAATSLAALCSSHGWIRLFGLLTLLSLGIAYWFYTVAYYSVWCFFAATLSLLIHGQFRAQATGQLSDKEHT